MNNTLADLAAFRKWKAEIESGNQQPWTDCNRGDWMAWHLFSIEAEQSKIDRLATIVEEKKGNPSSAETHGKPGSLYWAINGLQGDLLEWASDCIKKHFPSISVKQKAPKEEMQPVLQDPIPTQKQMQLF